MTVRANKADFVDKELVQHSNVQVTAVRFFSAIPNDDTLTIQC